MSFGTSAASLAHIFFLHYGHFGFFIRIYLKQSLQTLCKHNVITKSASSSSAKQTGHTLGWESSIKLLSKYDWVINFLGSPYPIYIFFDAKKLFNRSFKLDISDSTSNFFNKFGWSHNYLQRIKSSKMWKVFLNYYPDFRISWNSLLALPWIMLYNFRSSGVKST